MGSERLVYRVLVVEDCSATASHVFDALVEDRGLRCERLTWDAFAHHGLPHESPALVIAVIHPDSSHLSSGDVIEHHAGATPVLAIISEGDDAAVLVATRVAEDFLFAPVRPLELRHRVARLLAGARPSQQADTDPLLEEIAMTRLVGRNPAFMQAIRLVPRYARANTTVLVTGETGTGKEVCARAIHHLSARRHAPFVTVDCGALPDQLFENELFGHTRGAFTDAHRDQKGLVVLAAGGTLFLDEIDALTVAAQAKLLRFLQDQTFRPLGSERNERADVRIVAASNRELDARIQAQEFRADLYFRLNILRVKLPPLRDRRDDIPLLVHSLIEEFSQGGRKHVSSAAMRKLTFHDWPGNVRELANVVQRAIVECEGLTILPEHVDLPAAPRPAPLHFRAARQEAVATFERHYVETLLRKHRGNVTHAAREAHQDRRAFGRVIKKYNIDRGGF